MCGVITAVHAARKRLSGHDVAEDTGAIDAVSDEPAARLPSDNWTGIEG